jgi:septal ring factor EnvC (AmiA/AmiB activator)
MDALVKVKYELVDANIEHERLKEEKRALVKQREAEEADARAELDAAKQRLKDARKEYALVDTDFRAGRRAQNARLQAEAVAVGAKTYVTGTPCRNGHLSPRYTSSGACVMCDRIGWEGGKLRTSETHD